jgi:hypothetical protein
MKGYSRWRDVRAEYVERAGHHAIHLEDGDIAAIA